MLIPNDPAPHAGVRWRENRPAGLKYAHSGKSRAAFVCETAFTSKGVRFYCSSREKRVEAPSQRMTNDEQTYRESCWMMSRGTLACPILGKRSLCSHHFASTKHCHHVSRTSFHSCSRHSHRQATTPDDKINKTGVRYSSKACLSTSTAHHPPTRSSSRYVLGRR